MGEIKLKNKEIKELITINYNNSCLNKRLDHILKRKNNYYLKDEKNNTICKLVKISSDKYNIFIKDNKKWELKGNDDLKNIFKYINIVTEEKDKKTICFSKDERKRLERGIYRYIESKCDFLSNKDFEPRVRFGRIYFDFYVDDIFRINFYDKGYRICSLDKSRDKKNWKEIKNGSFDEVMSFLNKYFKNHYVNDEII